VGRRRAAGLCERLRDRRDRLQPLDLLDAIKTIERDLGRVETVRWGPRVIDIDILFYGEASLEDERLTLPHKELLRRAFVLIPLAEIAPDRLISGLRVIDAARLIGGEGVRTWRTDDPPPCHCLAIATPHGKEPTAIDLMTLSEARSTPTRRWTLRWSKADTCRPRDLKLPNPLTDEEIFQNLLGRGVNDRDPVRRPERDEGELAVGAEIGRRPAGSGLSIARNVKPDFRVTTCLTDRSR